MRVAKITGGIQMLHALARSEIVVGVDLTVVRNDWGPVLVAIAAKRIALGRELAYHVHVSISHPR
ncbi:MAG: ferrous iron transport protein A [Chloroflexaceae bacterium]|nr:ferrous iron transport protein A [Chloroflexaceae bacterium]